MHKIIISPHSFEKVVTLRAHWKIESITRIESKMSVEHSKNKSFND